jgi:hypothetical protein
MQVNFPWMICGILTQIEGQAYFRVPR